MVGLGRSPLLTSAHAKRVEKLYLSADIIADITITK